MLVVLVVYVTYYVTLIIFRASKEMDIDDEDIMEETETGLDTSLNIKELASPKKAVSKQKVAKIVTEIAVDAEMEEI